MGLHLLMVMIIFRGITGWLGGSTGSFLFLLEKKVMHMPVGKTEEIQKNMRKRNKQAIVHNPTL